VMSLSGLIGGRTSAEDMSSFTPGASAWQCCRTLSGLNFWRPGLSGEFPIIGAKTG
jgi:hypothetical protein